MIGTQLDKYEVLQKIGEGGMATVYLGRHHTLGRDVAIKVLHPHLSSSTRNRKRFAREARAIEHLRHQNILEIFDYSGVDTQDCYIITEFVQGETLSDLRERRGRLPSEIATLVGIDLANALHYAHERGVLHRDLKPDNVMVRRDGTVKLMDFGIARFLDESQVTLTGALVGSPAYMSPEQAAEESLDARSDIFALGTLLFHLVTGHRPFSGSNPSLILKNIIEGNRAGVLDLTPTMSADLADIIERCMASERDDRFHTALGVAEALGKALAEAEIDRDDSWGLGAYLTDADDYERRLHEHLAEVLIRRGRACLDAGDHLQALRLFNRLLSMDEDNEEVLTLVQGLHLPHEALARRRAMGAFAAGVLVLLSFGGLLAWLVFSAGQPSGIDADAAASNLTPSQPAQMRSELPPPSAAQPSLIAPSPEPVPPPSVTAQAAPAASPPPRPRPAPVPQTVRLPTGQNFELPMRPAPDERAYLKVVANNPADVYADGKKIGTTRPARFLELRPGAHKITIRSELFKEQRREVDLAPGEELELTVSLQPRHTTLSIDPAWPGACGVVVNGSLLGTVEELGRAVQIEHPDRAHTVIIDCAGERQERHWAFLIEDTNFGPP